MKAVEKEEKLLLITIIPQEVRDHYARHYADKSIALGEFNMEVFRRCYAAVAQKHNLRSHERNVLGLNSEEYREQHYYYQYYTLSIQYVMRWLADEKKQQKTVPSVPRHGRICEVPHCLCEPIQQDLFHQRLPHHAVRTAVIAKPVPPPLLVHAPRQLDLFEKCPPVAGRPLSESKSPRHP